MFQNVVRTCCCTGSVLFWKSESEVLFYFFEVCNTWRWSFHIPRDIQNNITKWGKHGERRGGKKTPLAFLVFGRPGGSVPCRDIGAGLRGRKPGARPPAGVSSGLAIAVWAPAAVGTEAAGLGEAVVQHLCRPDTQHLILVNVESAFNHVFRPFWQLCKVAI